MKNSSGTGHHRFLEHEPLAVQNCAKRTSLLKDNYYSSIDGLNWVVLSPQDLTSNSPFYLHVPFHSSDLSSHNMVLDQPKIPLLIFFFILITCLIDMVLIL